MGILLFYSRISFSGPNSEPQIYHDFFTIVKFIYFYLKSQGSGVVRLLETYCSVSSLSALCKDYTQFLHKKVPVCSFGLKEVWRKADERINSWNHVVLI